MAGTHPRAPMRARRFALALGPAAVVGLWGLYGGCATSGTVPGGIPPAAPDFDRRPAVAETAGPAGSHAPSTTRPVRTPEADAAHLAAQRALLPDDDLLETPRASVALPADPRSVAPSDDVLAHLPGSSGIGAEGTRPPAVDGNRLGTYVPLEGPPPADALGNFYRALDALARGEDPDGKVRVLVYGASHTEADIYPHYLRVYLRHRFGDGGHGFIQAAKPKPWYRHIEMRVASTRHWLAEHAQRTKGRQDGLFGLSGLSTTTRKRSARTKITHAADSVASHYEVFFLEQPSGGSFDLFVDGRKQARVPTRAEAVGAGVYAFDVPEGAHALEIRPRGDGEVRLFGVVAEREGPGVVVDTLGIGGTRAANMLTWDPAIWSAYVARRDPALVVLAYGTNEATDEDQPIEAYARDLDAVLDRIEAAAPNASCVLMGPGDFPVVGDDGTVVARPRLSQIVEVQREAARRHGCAFWDMLAFMGGPGSMAQWVAAQPAMARSDHIHLTRRGYAKVGMAFVDALFSPYDAGRLATSGREIVADGTRETMLRGSP